VPFVRFEHVCTFAGKGRRGLDQVSFEVAKGEAVVLVGPNGSGKSTVLRLIAGLRAPDEGRVLVDGVDLATLDYAAVQRHRMRLGFVFETGGVLANRSLADNIAFPLQYHVAAELSAADIRARTESIAREIGIESDLDAIGVGIHAGLARAALFARALTLEPALLLVDEPGQALSARQMNRISGAIERRRTTRNLTVLYADHDGVLPSFVIDRRLYVHRGRVDERPSVLDTDSDHSFVASSDGMG
jgi:ABC-type sulfate/molybdate transport systems ATPase subunit